MNMWKDWARCGVGIWAALSLVACGGGGSGDPQEVGAASVVDSDFSAAGEPLQAAQWHLWAQGVNLPAYGAALENTGQGVSVAVLDTAIAIDHPELRGRVAVFADFVDGDEDPSPNNTSTWHGTAVAGTIAAAARGPVVNEGGRGVAPLAQLMAFRVVPDYGSDGAGATWRGLSEAARRGARVINNSWTHVDGSSLTDADLDWQETLAAAMTRTTPPVVMFAAGNEAETNDATADLMRGEMSAWDSFTNSRHVITVGSTDTLGRAASYSETGANVLVAAPGGGRVQGALGFGGLVTTDLVGKAGAHRALSPEGDYLEGDEFVGTSGANAVASGVVALMLQANPNLGPREVAWILADTAVAVDCADGVCDAWLAPQPAALGVARLFSHKYGFGRIDASAAVARAQSMSPFGALRSCRSGLMSLGGREVPEAGQALVSGFTAEAGVCPSVVERVEVVLKASPGALSDASRYSGELWVQLRSPQDTLSTLTRPHACGSRCGDLRDGFTFNSVRHMGEPAAGEWTLEVADGVSNDTRALWDAWEVRLYGH
jgi:kexin